MIFFKNNNKYVTFWSFRLLPRYLGVTLVVRVFWIKGWRN